MKLFALFLITSPSLMHTAAAMTGLAEELAVVAELHMTGQLSSDEFIRAKSAILNASVASPRTEPTLVGELSRRKLQTTTSAVARVRTQTVYANDTVAHLMRGKHIRVVLMLDPAMVQNDTDPDPAAPTQTLTWGGLRYKGFAMDLLQKMADKAGFTYEVVRGSKEGNGGTWGNAWNDMAHWGPGKVNADLFFSGSFFTAGRQKVADCTASFLDTGLATIVYRGTKKSTYELLIDSMWTLFTPFKVDLWALLGLSIVLYAICMYFMERHSDEESLQLQRLKGDNSGQHRKPDPWTYSGIVNEAYLSVVYFTLAAGRVDPKTPFGKLLSLVFSMYTLVMVSAYTANLASILTLRAGATAAFSSMEHIIESGNNVCLWKGAAYTNLLIVKHPEMNYQEVTTTQIFNGEALAMVKKGDCAGLSIPEMHSVVLLSNPDNCDFEVAGGRDMPMNYVGGVSRWSPNIDVRTISYWLSYLREHQEGGGTFHEKLYAQTFSIDPLLCKDNEAQIMKYDDKTGLWTYNDDNGAGLSTRDVGGMIVIVFCACVGIFIQYKVIDIKHNRFLRRLYSRADSDNSKRLEYSEVMDLVTAMGMVPVNSTLGDKELVTRSVMGDMDSIQYGDFFTFWEAQAWDVKSHLYGMDVRKKLKVAKKKKEEDIKHSQMDLTKLDGEEDTSSKADGVKQTVGNPVHEDTTGSE